jgi:signal peptidase II
VRKNSLTIFLGLLVVTGAWLLDRLTKNLVIEGWIRQGPVFLSWVQTTVHHNFGLLGNLPFPRWSIFFLTGTAMLLLAYGLYDALKGKNARNFLSLSLVMGGALGNLYDRLALGYVFDWLMFFKTSIINLADAFITLGLIMYAVNHLRKQACREGVDEIPAVNC